MVAHGPMAYIGDAITITVGYFHFTPPEATPPRALALHAADMPLSAILLFRDSYKHSSMVVYVRRRRCFQPQIEGRCLPRIMLGLLQLFSDEAILF